MSSLRHALALAVTPRKGLIPWQTLAILVLASPLIALLISRRVIHGTQSDRFHVLAGAVAYALAICLSLHVAFNVVLARVRSIAEGPAYRFAIYWVVAVLVTAAVTQACAPVFAWMDVTLDPARRMVQGTVIVTFYLAGALLSQHATRRIADEQGRALKERAAALDARFQALQARTNPHFLFNTLSSIMTLVRPDPDQAEQLLGRLSTLMRYSIEGADRSHVSLREELEAVRDYIAIEQARFGKRLGVTLDVGDDVNLAARVPPMVLQPLVENAILHGVARSVDGGHVRVAAGNLSGGVVELVVDDDGAPEEASPHVGTKTALSNLRERLRILYGDHASLEAGRRAGGGFRARVTIPATPAGRPS